MKYFKLNDGIEVPAIGLGTFKITEEKDMDHTIEAALEAGYTYFDTAKYYHNEDILGKYLKESGKKRSDYQIATKVWPSAFGYDATKKSLDDSLKDLKVDYIDVALIHWYGEGYKETWEVFNDYKNQGLIKSIGVCNFSINQMTELLKEGPAPVLDQLESHPHLQDVDTHNFLKETNILHQAWSPLTQGKSNIFQEVVVKNLAKKYGKSPAQIILKWNISRGVMVLAKSSHKERIRENIDIFNFELTDEDMKAMASLDKKQRYSADPEDEKWLEEAGNI